MSESMAGGESSRMWASEVEPAVHSEGRREVTIGVVGTAAANRRIFRVAERMDGSVRLSGAVCEDAGGARQKALQLVADVDVILFSGPLSYDLALESGELPVPAVFVPPGGSAIPTMMLRASLHDRVDLKRVSFDTVSASEVHDTYAELGMPSDDVHVLEYRRDLEPGDYFEFHQACFAEGRTASAVTTHPAVEEKLREAGVPVLMLRPDVRVLRAALGTALLVGGGASLSNERTVFLIVRVPDALAPRRKAYTNSSFTQLRLDLMQELLREGRRMDALVLPLDDTGVLVCASMGSLRAATDDLSTMPMVRRLREALGFDPEIGIGAGRTAAEAIGNAERAAGMTAESEGRAAVMVGPEGMVVRIPSDGAGERTVTFGESEPREAEILRQLLDAMAEAGVDSGTVQAEQVAELLGVTLRTARRYLRGLVDANLAWRLPPTQTSKVGRPPIPYRLLDHRLRD